VTACRSRASGSRAPTLFFPILAFVERIDRWARRIQPVRPGASVIAIQRHRWRGPAVSLADGTVVGRGDLAPVIHFENRHLREVAGSDWQTAAYAAARDDLRVLAAKEAALPLTERATAFTGASVLAVLAQRLGFDLRPRRQTAWVRLEDWYLRTLLARWAPEGTRRLSRGRRPLVSQRVWLSGAELQRRWGPR